MRTRWRRGGSSHDDLSLWRCSAVLPVYVDSVWHHATRGAANDGSLWRVLLCAVCWRNHRRQLADVANQTLETYRLTACRPGPLRVERSLRDLYSGFARASRWSVQRYS